MLTHWIKLLSFKNKEIYVRASFIEMVGEIPEGAFLKFRDGGTMPVRNKAIAILGCLTDNITHVPNFVKDAD